MNKIKHFILTVWRQHPSAHGVLRLILELDGEIIIKADIIFKSDIFFFNLEDKIGASLKIGDPVYNTYRLVNTRCGFGVSFYLHRSFQILCPL